ncbi:DUF5983 family protein [Paenibacillus gallinarum]|uniref:DUF5983 domain-containing protein n=1 Tax=Paenibacillus gallinarum TaxID=2762232 RepID=A0ABR8T3G8_9BACL|nr:hypothetical protein [Paenibacillus gallinarum]MBD7970327.1 hypothetical protein [Paenibacillus gallinarum]
MKTQLILSVRMFKYDIQEVKTYFEPNAYENAAADFEDWTKIPYSEYLKRIQAGEYNLEILGKDLAGSTLYFAPCASAPSLNHIENETMVTISTAHITEEVNSILLDDEIQGLIQYKKGDYGYFIYVPTEEKDETLEFPECIQSILNYAHQHDATWIMLDRDAAITPELQTYEW